VLYILFMDANSEIDTYRSMLSSLKDIYFNPYNHMSCTFVLSYHPRGANGP